MVITLPEVTLYEVMKKTYMEEMKKTERYFNTHHRRIENSMEWLVMALCLCQSEIHPYEVRKAAKEYANKLVERIPL